MKHLALVLLVLLGVAVAPGAAATSDPLFRVTVKASYEEWMTYRFRTAAGCGWAEATRRVKLATMKPFVRRLSKLDAGNFVFDLAADEVRTASHGELSACTPQDFSLVEDDVSACGRASYTVGRIGTGVGFYRFPPENRFTFYFTRIGPEPYAGRCAYAVWGGGAHRDPAAPRAKNANFTFTKRGPGGEPYGREPWVYVDRSKLRTAKRYVVRWADSLTMPKSPSGIVLDNRLELSWEVTLVRVG